MSEDRARAALFQVRVLDQELVNDLSNQLHTLIEQAADPRGRSTRGSHRHTPPRAKPIGLPSICSNASASGPRSSKRWTPNPPTQNR